MNECLTAEDIQSMAVAVISFKQVVPKRCLRIRRFFIHLSSHFKQNAEICLGIVAVILPEAGKAISRV